MSVGEVVGLTIAAALVGGAAGVALIVSITLPRQRLRERESQKADAFSRWLAARITLSRTSISLVAAFRSLAAARPDSTYFPLRMEEAQRTRASWSDAMRELDLAEASLRTPVRTPAVQERLMRFNRIGADALQVAIDGDEQEVARLVQTLRAADQAAIELVESVTAGSDVPPRQSVLGPLLQRPRQWLGTIVEQWSER